LAAAAAAAASTSQQHMQINSFTSNCQLWFNIETVSTLPGIVSMWRFRLPSDEQGRVEEQYVTVNS
jgi:hypothetical protein